MSSKSACVCRQCDFLMDGCESCGKCFPRYRCCIATYVPGTYSTKCPTVIRWKMAYDCQTGWGEIPRAFPPRDPVGVNVQIQRVGHTGTIENDCRWLVTIAGEQMSVAWADLTTTLFEADGPDGGSYEIRITGGTGVCYPYSNLNCSPCKCGTCMPAAYKVRITNEYPNSYVACTDSVCTLASWDEDILEYFGAVTIGDTDVEIRGIPLRTECGVRFEISELPGIDPFVLSLEGGSSSSGCSPVDGYVCVDKHYSADPAEGIRINRKSPNANCVADVVIPLADYTITVEDPDLPGTTMMYIYITDGSCEQCETASPTCPGACIDLDQGFRAGGCESCLSLTGTLISECDGADDTIDIFAVGTGGCPISINDAYTATSLADAISAYAAAHPDVTITSCQVLFYGAKSGVEGWSWGSPGWTGMRIGMCYVTHGCDDYDGQSKNPYHYAIWYEGYKNVVGYPDNVPPDCVGSGSSSITSGLVFPTYASCEPLILEFPFLDFNLAFDCPPTSGPPNPCEGQNGATVLRITA